MTFSTRPSLMGVTVVLALLLPPTAGWIPFMGEEIHRHLYSHIRHGEWDLLRLLPDTGASRRRPVGRIGPLNATTYRLKGRAGGQLEMDTTNEVLSRLSDELSVYLVLRQHNNTLATMLAAALPGSSRPWLQVNSDLRRQQLQLLYRVKFDPRTHQATFPLPKKAGVTWTKMLLSLNGTQARLWVNCHTVEKKLLDGPLDLHMPHGGLFYFNQDAECKNKLLGSIQAAKLFNFAMTSRLWRCTFDGQFGPGWKPPLIG